MADLSFDDVPMAKRPSAARSPDISFDDVPLTKRPTPKPAPKPRGYFEDVSRNFGPDVQRQITGIKAALANPAATVGALRDVALGGLENSRYAMDPGNSGFMKPIASPAQRKAAYDVYEGMRQHIAHPVTSFRKEPVSTLMDWSAPLTLGGGALATAPVKGANIAGRALTVAGEISDPVSLALKSTGAGLKAAKRALPPPRPKPPVAIGSDLTAVREAALRQNLDVPTTMVSPKARLAADIIPPGLAINAVRAAEKAVEPALGERIIGLAAEHGPVFENAELGTLIQKDAARWSETMRDKGSKLFTEAHALAEGTPIVPENTEAFLKSQLEVLGKTPKTGARQIQILKDVSSDLLDPANPPSLESMRATRSNLYGMLSASDIGLTPSQKGGLVEALWGNMSTDMEKSLSAAAEAGNPGAAQSLAKLQEANATWAERSGTVKRVLSKVLGKNENDILEMGNDVWGADKSPEQALSALKTFTTSDERSLRKIMATVDPSTQEAIKASVIHSLGRPKDGHFNPQTFLNNFASVPPASRDLLFGKEASAALDDVKTISEAVLYRRGDSGSWGAKMLKGLLTVGQYGAPLTQAGNPAMAGGAMALGLGFNTLTAHTLASPTAARWLAKIAKASDQGQEAVGKVLNQMGTAAMKDPEVSALRKVAQQVALNPDAYLQAAEKPAEEKSEFDDMTDEEIEARLKELQESASLEPVINAIEGVEGGPNAGANIGGTSSATGPGQFVRDTFIETYKAAFPEEAANMSDDEIAAIHGTEEGNRIQHETLLPLLTQNNAERLKSEGFEATPPEVYLAHFLGVVGAMRLLGADPNAAVEDVVSPESVAANKSVLKGKTVGDVLRWAEEKMAEHGAP